MSSDGHVDTVELRAWAENPASSGTVPVYPATLRRIADKIERLTAEVATLREQLAAREARIADLNNRIQHFQCFKCGHVHDLASNPLIYDSTKYLREHEARLLEEMARVVKIHLDTCMTRSQNIKIDRAVAVGYHDMAKAYRTAYDILSEEAAARRTK